MITGGRRDVWVCLTVVVGSITPALAGPPPIELVHGGRLPGRVLETADPTVVRVAAELFAEPVEFVAAAVVSNAAAAEPPHLHGLPGRVGLLTSGEVRLLGCIAPCVDGRVGWQPLGGTGPVAFADHGGPACIDYRGLDVVAGPGITLARRGRAGDRSVVDMSEDGPAARDGRLHIGDTVVTIAEGRFGRPVKLSAAQADDVKLLLIGPVGSTVRLGVRRENGVEEISLVRDARGCDDLAGAAAGDVLDRALVVQQSLGGLSRSGPANVHLVTGESFACAVLDADRQTVRVGRGDRGELTIPTDSIRALELSLAGGRAILKQKLARLLTVPRLQQASPPTHVVRMTGGDYLRGRLVGIDSEVVRFDVAGEAKSLPRREVARIIRLAAPADSQPGLRAALSGRDGLPLVIMDGDGRLQAVAATGLRDDAVVGDSPSLGPTAIPLDSAAKVLLGAAIDQVAVDDPYAQWVWRAAASGKESTGERRR